MDAASSDASLSNTSPTEREGGLQYSKKQDLTDCDRTSKTSKSGSSSMKSGVKSSMSSKTDGSATSKAKSSMSSKTDGSATSKAGGSMSSKTDGSATSKAGGSMSSKTGGSMTSKAKSSMSSKTGGSMTSKYGDPSTAGQTSGAAGKMTSSTRMKQTESKYDNSFNDCK